MNNFKINMCVLCVLSLFALMGDSAKAEDEIHLETGEEWKGERLTLPPGFAKDMKWKGVEQIKFAPGMFTVNSKNFFSYVIVFRLEAESKITQETLSSELLTYYQGLASAVSRGSIKPESASIKISKLPAGNIPGLTHYSGTLNWVEPFASKKPQELKMKIAAWSDPVSKDAANAKNWAFIQVSPAGEDAMIWKEMESIQKKFLEGKLEK